MKKIAFLVVLLLSSILLWADYQVGETVANYYWTDNTGADHDIYELTAQAIVPVLFWGSSG
ncbi:MAG: hypothetical protein KAW88_01650 [Candidatus Cloacimonetes bacterium]|nr:hypothetical protein [Candidatus Cloacimonadota bacterium]